VTIGASGVYSFTSLPAGSYTITVTTPGGATWIQTVDPDDLDSNYSLSLASGQISGSHDFAYTATGPYTLGDTVYVDWNGDGTQNAVEPGISDISILLYEDEDGDGQLDAGVDALIDTTITDGSGFYVEERIKGALAALQRRGELPADLAIGGIDVEPTKDPAHGDVASNAAMVLAKPARAKPRDIAEKLKAELAREPGFVKLDVAGPGFLNITLAPSVWQGVVTSILKQGGAYGRSTLGGGEPINVEYVSANPTAR
jgi:hypothetical protein